MSRFRSATIQAIRTNLIMNFLKQLKYFIIALRPYQWSKNFIVFAALIFSGNLFNPKALLLSIVAFIAFCLASGATYVVNDIFDRKEDKIHPYKKNRPIASGNLELSNAILGAILVYISALIISYRLSDQFFFIIIFYILLNISYSLKLKHLVILDILIVSIGFVLRAIAGAVSIQALISPWLLVCTFFLALFLVIAKRRNELLQLKENASNQDRKSVV